MKIKVISASLSSILCALVIGTGAFAIDVNSFEELKAAISGTEEEISIVSDFSFTEELTISRQVSIQGNNKKLTRDSSFNGTLFTINDLSGLTINNLTIDGGAPNWKMDIENGANNSSGYFRANMINGNDDIVGNAPLIVNSGNLSINSSTFQNIRNGINNTSKSGGAIRNNKGTAIISNTTFKHCASYRDGGAINAAGGSVSVANSNFIDNTAGAGYTGQVHGGAIYVNGASDIVIDKTLFQDNFAQHNGGAIMLHQYASDIKIRDSIFKHNQNGNDGAAIALESTVNKHIINIESSVFDNNQGLAYSGQSMGTIWLDGWKNDETIPATFKNLTFTNNHVAHGSSFASYGANAPHCIIENVESYNNRANGVGSYFIQNGTYLIKNANIHDNVAANGAGIVSVGGNVTVDNSIMEKNTATQRGGGAMAIFGSLTIKNSKITNNHSNRFGGGIAAYSMYANYGNPELHLENPLVKDNSADEIGGGLSIQDTGTAHSIITVDDASKIYDNSATIAADDVFYTHENAAAGANTTLDNIGIAGLLGIDGWYFDEADDRFIDTDNPTVFHDFVENDGSVAFYIKAAGLSHGDYDGNGGETQALPVTVKYGSTYTIDDDVPVRDGYTFTGWNTKADGSGISLAAGDTYDGSDGWTLYAQWVPASQPISESSNPNTFDGGIALYLGAAMIIVLGSSVAVYKYMKR